MTVYNHVAGGIVFTGSFCSLFNINIFENKTSIAVCIIACILPDIDHTKSILGKMFFPLSKWLSRKYGHRTITHSLTAFIPLCLLFSFFEKFYFNTSNLTMIFTFGYLSHLILDMITLQGIPLFYPFTRNPCVIPANPNLRIRTGNLKSEGIALFIFSILTFTMQPLFENGFWTNYNNKFNDITHIYRQYNDSNNVLEIDYSYQFYGDFIKGSGLLVGATKTELRLLKNDNITIIQKEPNTIISQLDFRKTDSIYSNKKEYFNNITIDSLSSLISNKYILEADVYSNDKVVYDNKEVYSFNLQKSYNPNPPQLIKVVKNDNNRIKSQLNQERFKINSKRSKISSIKKNISTLQKEYEIASNYRKDRIILELKKLNSQLSSIEIDYSKLRSLEIELSQIKPQEDILFYGSITQLEFENSKAESIASN